MGAPLFLLHLSTNTVVFPLSEGMCGTLAYLVGLE